MSRRKKPFNRLQQLRAILAHARGAARNSDGTLQRVNIVTLAKINGLTLTEIEAKYGPIDKTNYVDLMPAPASVD